MKSPKVKGIKKGFTLIELLVVIAIIGLLSSIVLASLNTARAKARDASRLEEIKQIKTALEFYYDQNGFYPSLGADDTGYPISTLEPSIQAWLATISPDPTGQNWQYVRGPSKSSYGLEIYTEKIGDYCVTGVNINPGWWGKPPCPF
jgi:type II secretion system protein G